MLTTQEREIVLKAAELIASGQETYSCLAIKQAAGIYDTDRVHDPNFNLHRRYADFMGIAAHSVALSPEEVKRRWMRQRIRVMMLLTFAEIG